MAHNDVLMISAEIVKNWAGGAIGHMFNRKLVPLKPTS